jgi:hypothetical protein
MFTFSEGLPPGVSVQTTLPLPEFHRTEIMVGAQVIENVGVITIGVFADCETVSSVSPL